MILLTGSNGFVGEAIAEQLGAKNYLSLNRQNAHFNFDLSLKSPLFDECFDAVIHVAGKAHSVPRTRQESDLFYDVNYRGTVNLLEALEAKLPKAFIYISTVAVYGLSTGLNVDEDTPCLATDPYGKSKLMAEEYLLEWTSRKGIPCLIFRLPLVVGKEAPGNLKSMIDAITKGYYFNIGSGKVRRSMVMIEDVARIVAQSIGKSGIYNLTDGYHPTFYELSSLIAAQLSKRRPASLPMGIAKVLAFLGDMLGERAPINRSKLGKLTSELTFSDTRARTVLNWHSSRVLTSFKLL